MKTTFTFLILLLFNLGFSQSEMEIKKLYEKLAKEYLAEFYINKDYNSGSKKWDNGMLTEIENLYNKNEKNNSPKLTLKDKIKVDVEKYFKQLTSFKVNEILGSEIEKWNGKNIISVFVEYSETLNGKLETIRSMIIFIPSDDGKTWTIQDWKVKDIVKKCNEGLY
jgi:DNA-binding protein Fis